MPPRIVSLAPITRARQRRMDDVATVATRVLTGDLGPAPDCTMQARFYKKVKRSRDVDLAKSVISGASPNLKRRESDALESWKREHYATIEMRRNNTTYRVNIPSAWNISNVSPLRKGSYAIAYKCRIGDVNAVVLCRPLDAYLETEDCNQIDKATWGDCMPLAYNTYLKELQWTKKAIAILGNDCPILYHADVCTGSTNTEYEEFRATKFGMEVWEYFEYDVSTLLKAGRFNDASLRNQLLNWIQSVCSKLKRENLYYNDLHTGNILVSASLDRFALADLGSISDVTGRFPGRAGCSEFDFRA